MEHVELLRSIPMFQGLAEDDLGALSSTLVEQRFKAGQSIMEQGDSGAEMYIVATGHVNIFLPGESSRRVSLKDIARGEYFGELALFDEKPRSASALATTDAVLLALSRETLSRYLTERPGRGHGHPANHGGAAARDQRHALRARRQELGRGDREEPVLEPAAGGQGRGAQRQLGLHRIPA